MADFRIESIIINPNQTWQDVYQHQNWQVIKNTELTWGNTNQITEVNQPIFIEVEIIESSWSRVKSVITNWQSLKESISNWLGLKTY